MKKAFFLALFATCSTTLFSQQIYRVISENGLNLRDTPAKSGKILAVAPFLSEVTVLADSSKNWWERPFSPWFDTVGVLFKEKSQGSWRDVPHTGFWLECSFGGKKGFMFGGFLEKIPPVFMAEVSKWDYRLRTTKGNNCHGNFPEFEKSWNWNGLFKTQNGFELRPIQVKYAIRDIRDSIGYNVDEPHFSTQLDFRTDDEFQPIYFFGTNEKWPKRMFKNQEEIPFHSNFWHPKSSQDELESAKKEAKKLGLELVFDQSSKRWNWFLKKENGQLQAFEFGSKKSERVEKAEKLVWHGDLDGDGKADFIFECGANYEGGSTALFLSSIAKKGDAFGVAAVLGWWYCC